MDKEQILRSAIEEFKNLGYNISPETYEAAGDIISKMGPLKSFEDYGFPIMLELTEIVPNYWEGVVEALIDRIACQFMAENLDTPSDVCTAVSIVLISKAAEALNKHFEHLDKLKTKD